MLATEIIAPATAIDIELNADLLRVEASDHDVLLKLTSEDEPGAIEFLVGRLLVLDYENKPDFHATYPAVEFGDSSCKPSVLRVWERSSISGGPLGIDVKMSCGEAVTVAGRICLECEQPVDQNPVLHPDLVATGGSTAAVSMANAYRSCPENDPNISVCVLVKESSSAETYAREIPPSDVTMSGNSRDGVELLGTSVSLSVYPPAGETLRSRTHRAESSDADLELSILGCENPRWREFVIDMEADRRSGEVRRLHVTFEAACDNGGSVAGRVSHWQ